MRGKKEESDTLAGNLISATRGIRNDLLRFLLLFVVSLLFGGVGIAIAYGSWAGIFLLSLIMLFVLVVLALFRKSLSKPSSRPQKARRKNKSSGKKRDGR